MKKRKKNYYNLLKETRTPWIINPKTRVQENKLKSKKKRRQNEKKLINQYKKSNSNSSSFLSKIKYS